MQKTQQSDIVIEADGTINISFVWDDLKDLAGIQGNEVPPPVQTWSPPENIHFSAEEYRFCQLCPKNCGFNRTRYTHPNCGDAKLRISNFGVSFGDEPEIRGSQGSGIIMLSGCPLTCPSCHNPEKVAHGKETTVEEFFLLCKELLEKGAHNIQILSPTVHLPSLRTVLKALKDSAFPLPIIFKSSGYESVDELKKFEKLVDIYLPDFKFGPCSEWGIKAGVADYFERASEALKEMIRQTGPIQLDQNGVMQSGVLIRHVMAPIPDTEKSALFKFLADYATTSKVSFQDTFVTLE